MTGFDRNRTPEHGGTGQSRERAPEGGHLGRAVGAIVLTAALIAGTGAFGLEIFSKAKGAFETVADALGGQKDSPTTPSLCPDDGNPYTLPQPNC